MVLTNLFYAVINWINRPSTSTPLGQTNLNHMDNGILQCAQHIVALSQDKAENSKVDQMVKSVTVDADTGIITVIQQNEVIAQYDLDIERVVTNFDINDQNQLVLTLDDGTQKMVDLTRFVYAVDSTATIAMQIKDRKITASIVDGSVTMQKLDVAIQTEFRQYTLDAQAARDSALTYSRDARRYAVGGVVEGDKDDNAKSYKEETQRLAYEAVEQIAGAGGKVETAITDLETRISNGEFDGPPGLTGGQGVPGQTGQTGASGERGTQGRDGKDGRDGGIGPIGPQGEKGADAAVTLINSQYAFKVKDGHLKMLYTDASNPPDNYKLKDGHLIVTL